jgi:hypothetical protein
MPPSSRKLAQALAARLSDVLPPPYSARALEGAVAAFAGDDWLGSSLSPEIVEEGEDGTVEERLETVGRAVLSGVQDYVADDSTEPWPREPDGRMALPQARVDGDELRLWFGASESAAAVALRPIALSDLME